MPDIIITDQTLVTLENRGSFQPRVMVGITIDNLANAKVNTIQFSQSSWSETTDISLILPNSSVQFTNMKTTVDVANSLALPRIQIGLDGRLWASHRLRSIQRNVLYGDNVYSIRGVGPLEDLDTLGTLDFGFAPLNTLFSAHEILKAIIEASGTGFDTICSFPDFEVLQIHRFYRVSYLNMLRAVVGDLPISVYAQVNNNSSGDISIVFADTLVAGRKRSYSGRQLTSLTASISYVSPDQREWG